MKIKHCKRLMCLSLRRQILLVALENVEIGKCFLSISQSTIGARVENVVACHALKYMYIHVSFTFSTLNASVNRAIVNHL